jgi:2-phospho-L-lactate guanylyltransferase
MLTVAIFFKGLADPKSRLSAVLSPLERAAFARRMLLHVIDEASGARGVSEVFVVSPEPNIAAAVDGRDVRLLAEPRPEGLNAAAVFAAAELAAAGRSRLLLLPADLPNARSRHIEELVEAHDQAGTDIIVPSADESGTNALLVALPPRFHFAFGANSFNRHLANAARSERPLAVHRCPNIGVDIDQPTDLQHLPLGIVS